MKKEPVKAVLLTILAFCILCIVYATGYRHGSNDEKEYWEKRMKPVN